MNERSARNWLCTVISISDTDELIIYLINPEAGELADPL